ncbi:PQQ-dependent sugar dehydrogenase [Demequina sp.]|uniref:PQQ-dependent sugar dehydrogenase n=1 Tax=Demequina sp. TaxID=2050685 RepID=UPI003A894A58
MIDRTRLTVAFAVAAALGALALTGCTADAGVASASPSPSDASPVGPVTAGSETGTATAEPSDSPPTVTENVTGVEVTATEAIATGLDAPWDALALADGSWLVTERDAGRVLRVVDGESTPLAGPGADYLAAEVDAVQEAGLLGIATLPDDPSVVYAYLTRGDGNAVVRMNLDGDTLSAPTDVVTGIPKEVNHDGGRIAFGPDGYLYVATGDAAQGDLAQDLDSLAGKILRVVAEGGDDDGSPAPGNPFRTIVWSYGHRNVQGLAWLPDGTMVASEFGQSDADELNAIVPGANYGWPLVEGLHGAPDAAALGETVDGLTYPVAQWQPTAVASPSGIAATDAGIFVATLRGETLYWVGYQGGQFAEPVAVLEGEGRLRAAVTDGSGQVLVLTNNTDGRGSPADDDDRLLRLVLDVTH